MESKQSLSNLVLTLDKKISQYIQDNHRLEDNRDFFDYLLELPGETYREVKHRRTQRIVLDQSYFIKKHYPIDIKEIIKSFLKLSWPFDSAQSEHEAILELKRLNIKTMDIAGYGVKNKKSFIITKAIEPNISLDKLCELYLDHKCYFKLKRILIKYLAEQIRCLHNNGINHRDYYLCHNIVDLKSIDNIRALFDSNKNIDKATQENLLDNIYLIDLHRVQIRNKVPSRYIIKDLSALLFSARNYKLTRSDYYRFVKYYFKTSAKQAVKNNKFLLKKIYAKSQVIKEKG